MILRRVFFFCICFATITGGSPLLFADNQGGKYAIKDACSLLDIAHDALQRVSPMARPQHPHVLISYNYLVDRFNSRTNEWFGVEFSESSDEERGSQRETIEVTVQMDGTVLKNGIGRTVRNGFSYDHVILNGSSDVIKSESDLHRPRHSQILDHAMELLAEESQVKKSDLNVVQMVVDMRFSPDSSVLVDHEVRITFLVIPTVRRTEQRDSVVVQGEEIRIRWRISNDLEFDESVVRAPFKNERKKRKVR